MADKETLVIKVDLDTSQVKSELNNVEQTAARKGVSVGKEFGKGAKQGIASADAFSGLMKNALAVTGAIGVAIASFRAMSSSLGSVVNSAREFSKATAEVNSILPETARLTAETRKQFIALGAEFGTSAAKQAKSFYSIVSAGVQGTAKQVSVLRAANTAAVAGLTDINAATNVLVASMNTYVSKGLTATQASDSLFTAVREGITTFSELSTTLGSVAPLASQAGVSFSELSGAIAFITKSGVSTAEAVTQLRSALANVIKPQAEAVKLAKKLGLEFNVAALSAKGLGGFMEDVRKKTGGNVAVLGKLFGSIQGLNGVLSIVNGNSKDFARILDETANSAGAAAKAFKVISENLDFKLNQVAAEFSALAIVIGTALTPALEYFISLAKGARFAIEALINQKTVLNADQLKQKIEGTSVAIATLQKRIARADSGGSGLLGRFMSSGDKEQLAETQTQLKSYQDQLASLTVQQQTAAAVTSESVAASAMTTTASVAVAKTKAQELAEHVANIKADSASVGAAMLSGLSRGLTEITMKTKTVTQLAQGLGRSIKTSIGGGIAQGFAAFGAALVKGENALGAFLKAFLGAIGQAMIQQGALFTLSGLGYLFLPGMQAAGAALIGTGAALATAGGILSALVGGGQSVPATDTSTVSSTGGGTGYEESSYLDEEGPQLQESGPQVVVNVDTLVENDSGAQIIDLINKAFDTNGTIINRRAIA